MASDTVWILASRIVALVVGFAANLLLVRVVPRDSVGVFYLVWSVLLFAATLGRLGMDTAVVRLVPERLAVGRLAEARLLAVRACLVTIVVSGALALLATSRGWQLLARNVFGSSEFGNTRWAAGALLVALALQGTLVGCLRAYESMRAFALFDTLFATALWTAALIWVWSRNVPISPSGLLAIRAALFAVTCGAIVAVLARRFRPAASPIPVDRGWRALRIGPSLMVTTLVASFVGSTIDIVILGAFVPPAQVALYAVAASLSAVVAMPFLAGTVVLGPVIARLHGKAASPATIENLVRAATGLLAVPGTLILIAFVLLARPTVETLFGSEFRDAAVLLVVLSVAQWCAVVTGPCGLTLIMTGHHQAALACVVVGAALSIGLDLYAAPRYGAVGVAVATAAALALDNIATTIVAKRLTGIWTFARLGRAEIRTAHALFHRLAGGQSQAVS
jgi:O-antigen/teichoic acid export membrane protein